MHTPTLCVLLASLFLFLHLPDFQEAAHRGVRRVFRCIQATVHIHRTFVASRLYDDTSSFHGEPCLRHTQDTSLSLFSLLWGGGEGQDVLDFPRPFAFDKRGF